MDYVFRLFHSVECQLGYVDQTFFAWKNFYEGAEFHEPCYPAEVGFSGFHFMGEAFYDFLCLLGCFFVGGGNVDVAVFFDVQLRAGFILDLIDGLAAGTDDFADLVYGDGDGNDLRCIGRQVVSRFVDALCILSEDKDPCFMGLFRACRRMSRVMPCTLISI